MNTSHTQSFTLYKELNTEQKEHFDKYGFIHFKNFVDRATVREFIAEINRVQQLHLDQNNQKVNGVPLKFGKDWTGADLIQRLAFTSQYSQILSNFLKDPRLKSILPLLGDFDGRIGENEKDGLVVNHYVNSEYSEFSQMGWHTDSPRDLFLGQKIGPMLNVGLHLDDCPFENGGLRVLPGTHKQNLFDLFFKKKYFVDNTPDAKEVGLNIEAGDLTIHDGRIWHRVQQSPYIGEKSRRRVMYIPVITGAYSPKHANSPTPFYHKLGQLKLDKKVGELLSKPAFTNAFEIKKQSYRLLNSAKNWVYSTKTAI